MTAREKIRASRAQFESAQAGDGALRALHLHDKLSEHAAELRRSRGIKGIGAEQAGRS